MRRFLGVSTNKIKIYVYRLPRSEKFLANLSRDVKFTVLDPGTAYLQVELDEECIQLTTINTPQSLYIFKRFPFALAYPPLFGRELERKFWGIRRTSFPTSWIN